MLGLNPESICSLLTIFFLSYYAQKNVYPILTKICDNYNFFKLFSVSQVIITDQVIKDAKPCEKEEVKYEDKFLVAIRKMDNRYIFDENERELERNKFDELFLLAQEEYNKKANDVKDRISSIERIIKYNDSSDDEFCTVEYNENSENSETSEDDEHIKNLTEEKVELEKVLTELNNTQNMEEIRLQIQEKARQFVIDVRLDKLKNSFVMEKTPLGNVLMLYNNKRGSFEFYSDNTIPYRYLEPVSRKYVKTFDCRPIYFDMEEELKDYERKLEKKRLEEERKLEQEKKLEEDNNNLTVIVEPKKNVFAKFKSYNKDSGTGHVNIGAPPKNSIPNNKVTESSNNNNENVLLKENANRYSYEGKLSNFNFLKKVDRKVVDKKYGMTFADFKRLQEEKKNKK
jgi:hypothetical protein